MAGAEVEMKLKYEKELKNVLSEEKFLVSIQIEVSLAERP